VNSAGFWWNIARDVDILIEFKSLGKTSAHRIIFSKNSSKLNDAIKIRVYSGSFGIKEKKFHKSDV
jgi:hypothetical protein